MTPAGLSFDTVGQFFWYRRCGHDERLLHLQPGGCIGQGAADREQRWELRIHAGEHPQLLFLGADGAVTCALSRENDGRWRGSWIAHERMPVELVPAPDGANRHEWGIEIGAGEHPHPGYHVHTDILPLPGIECVCPMDRLPYPDGTFTALRANDVLEHQSWALVPATLREWARVLIPGGHAYIQVPDGRRIVEKWLSGELSTPEVNYWLLGGHASDRAAHQGHDDRGVPRWLWNAHHTLFTADWLRELLLANGFDEPQVQSDGGSNLMCWTRRRT